MRITKDSGTELEQGPCILACDGNATGGLLVNFTYGSKAQGPHGDAEEEFESLGFLEFGLDVLGDDYFMHGSGSCW